MRTVTKSVQDVTSKETTKVINDLVDTMREMNLVGMAAPQKKSEMYEGCGSVLQGALFAGVPRSQNISTEWIDEQGTQHESKFAGFLAQIIQHESDHLQGTLFIDRVKDTKTYITAENYRKKKS